MSVRAYIVREKNIWVDEKNMTFQYDNNGPDSLVKYTHKDEEFCFNFWGQSDFADIVRRYCCFDGTNDDSAGTMEMEIEEFEEMVCENSFTDPDDLESIRKMQEYFDEGYYLIIFNCY